MYPSVLDNLPPPTTKKLTTLFVEFAKVRADMLGVC